MGRPLEPQDSVAIQLTQPALDEADFAAALEYVRACESAPDIAAFRDAVVRIIDHVPGHLVSYNEVDLLDGSAFVQIEPRRDQPWVFERIERFERLAHQHPVIAHFAETGELGPRAISDVLSDAEFRALDLHREFFAHYEVADQIAFGLPSSPRMVLGVAINRRERGFSARDRAFLRLVAPRAGMAYLAARARTLAAGAVGAAGDLVVIDEGGCVRALAGRAGALLEDALGERPVTGAPLPSPVARLLDELAAAPPLSAGAERVLHEDDGSSVTARLVLGQVPGVARVLVLREDRDPLTGDAGRRLGLSARETQIANLVARGRSNAGIAAELTISPHTVKRHLERIYAKVGVGSRAALVAALLGRVDARR